MKIEIEQIVADNTVYFSSEFGKGIATWGENEPQCKKYEVEIDIEDNLIWGKSINKSNATIASISVNETVHTLVGVLDSIDEDGYSVLRMGNAIISFFADGKAFDIGNMIEIKAEKIVLTPYD